MFKYVYISIYVYIYIYIYIVSAYMYLVIKDVHIIYECDDHILKTHIEFVNSQSYRSLKLSPRTSTDH